MTFRNLSIVIAPLLLRLQKQGKGSAAANEKIDRGRIRFRNLAALDKYYLLLSKFANETYLKQMAELFANFSNAKQYKERFAVHVGRSVTLIPVEDIALFAKEEVIYLINKEGKKFITDFRSLDEIQELVDPGIFYRANRQHIVHHPFIESYRSDDTGRLIIKLRNGKADELIISKERAAEFRKWFE